MEEHTFKVDALVKVQAPNIWAGELAKVTVLPTERRPRYTLALVREDAMDGHMVIAPEEQLDEPSKEELRTYAKRQTEQQQKQEAAEE